LASERPFLLATRNAHKASEIRAILGGGVRLLSLDEAGIDVSPDEDHIETYETFRENALAKAAWFHRHSGMPTIADDSGICAEALDGRPGVRSRRFSGRSDLDGHDLDLANNRALADALAKSGHVSRTVRYVCAAVLVQSDQANVCSIGAVRGTFVTEPRGAGGFGYDPHFLVERTGHTFAELDPAGKHRLSHRGRAFRALSTMLRDHRNKA
jgi:XTP/dITP diphosphohydrolase